MYREEDGMKYMLERNGARVNVTRSSFKSVCESCMSHVRELRFPGDCEYEDEAHHRRRGCI